MFFFSRPRSIKQKQDVNYCYINPLNLTNGRFNCVECSGSFPQPFRRVPASVELTISDCPEIFGFNRGSDFQSFKFAWFKRII